MRLLFCCEFYYPSVGGVQEVMRQIAERMVQIGHEVTVATTRLAERTFCEYNGVHIAEFGVTGNLVRGIKGEVKRYRDFVTQFQCDAILIKAAQQWTFDALWPVLDQINARKVFIPCGFSGLYEPTYGQYFLDLTDILKKFDHLIFYAECYRDINFARDQGLTHWTVLPNGASEVEFMVPKDTEFRKQHGIPESSFVFLTVGSMTGVKGHREVLEAFAKLKHGGRHVTLILNGNPPPSPVVEQVKDAVNGKSIDAARQPVLKVITRSVLKNFDLICNRVQRVAGMAFRSFGVLRHEGWAGIHERINAIVARKLIAFSKILPQHWFRSADPIGYWINQIDKQRSRKLLLKVNFPRSELVQAFMAADLFVFASNVEYSPLVLFESAAAGTTFLTVPVGNAEEIALWTGGGIMCPAPKDDRGYTRVNPEELALSMMKAMVDPQTKLYGVIARERWEKEFTWARIAQRYEEILRGPVL